VFAWIVIVGAVLAVAGLVTMLVRGLGQLPLVVVLIVLAVAAAVYLWRFALHPRIVFDGQLWVVNPMRTHILEAAEVSSITPGPDGLRVRHGEGTIEAWAVQKSSRSLRTGRRTRADAVADTLTGLLHGSTASPTPDAATAPAPSVAEKITQAPVSPPSSPESPQPSAVSAASAGADVSSPASPATLELPGPIVPLTPDSPNDTEWPTLEMPITLPSRTVVEPEPTRHEDAPSAADTADTVSDEYDDEDDGDDLIIRRANPGDREVLVDLERRINSAALHHVFAGVEFPTEAVSERWADALQDRGTKVRIAEIDGEPVGYLCYDERRLRHVGLTSEHTRRGHGRALVEYAVDDMFSRGVDHAELQVLEQNTAALGFYRHLGWTDTGARTPSAYPPHPVELTLAYQRED